MSPRHCLLGTDGGLVNERVGRTACDADEEQLLQAKSVCRAKDRADVVHATHIVEEYGQWYLGRGVVLLGSETLHLEDGGFLYRHSRTGALLGIFVPFRLEELDELLVIVLLEQYLAITCRATAAERLLELTGEVCQIAV